MEIHTKNNAPPSGNELLVRSVQPNILGVKLEAELLSDEFVLKIVWKR